MRSSRTILILLTITLTTTLLTGITFADDKPTTQPADSGTPALIKPDDKDAIAANQDKDVVIEGVVDSAAWSSSGKVLKATFKDSGDTKLQFTIFSKNKDKFDAGFNEDIAKSLTGAKVRVKGKLKDYKGTPELVLDTVDQLTIEEPATTQN